MIKFFRKIRQRLVTENKFSKYLLYAIGEIILVVIGILIALQINNLNEAKKLRAKEVQFLNNLKSDLIMEEQELNRYIDIRESIVNSAHIILEHFNGEPVDDIQLFNYHVFNVAIWQVFQRNNNTFKELVNSGNLTAISNEAVKNGLLNMDLIYKKIESDREHLRNDYEHYIYNPWFENVDLDPLAQSFTYYATNGEFDEHMELSRDELDGLLDNTKFKNGFVLSVFTNSLILNEYDRMKKLNVELIGWIDEEVAEQ